MKNVKGILKNNLIFVYQARKPLSKPYEKEGAFYNRSFYVLGECLVDRVSPQNGLE